MGRPPPRPARPPVPVETGGTRSPNRGRPSVPVRASTTIPSTNLSWSSPDTPMPTRRRRRIRRPTTAATALRRAGAGAAGAAAAGLAPTRRPTTSTSWTPQPSAGRVAVLTKAAWTARPIPAAPGLTTHDRRRTGNRRSPTSPSSPGPGRPARPAQPSRRRKGCRAARADGAVGADGTVPRSSTTVRLTTRR